MKTKTWFFLFGLFVTLIRVAQAQEIYQIKVILKDGNRVYGSFLYSKQDSLFMFDHRNSRRIDLGVSEILSIRVRGRKKVANVFIGAALGAEAGAILKMVLQSPLSYQEHLLEPEMAGFGDVAMLGLFVGGVTGAIASESGAKFKIHGDRLQFGLFLDYISYASQQVKTATLASAINHH